MALKFLRAHAVATGQPRRHRVISLMPGYHGATLQTLGLNGDVAVPPLWGPMAVSSDKIPAPLTFRATSPGAAAAASLAALEETVARIGPDQVLALVMEPIGGQSSGVNVPHPSFASGARAVCDRHGIRLVFDESVCAFRTGRFLATHHAPDARPDVVVLAKGLAAGYAPLGAALMPAQLVEEVAATTGFTVSHSYDANPIACAAGAAVLDEIVERDLIARAAAVGEHLRAGLEAIARRSPLVGDVRGRGLLLAIELVADPDTLARFPPEVDPGAIALRHGLDHGLLLYSRRQNSGRYGDWLLIAPPLVIQEADCDDLLSRLDATLGDAAEELLARSPLNA
jgi:adenosylmethionine-8-amino-7-oxononanoate aminotransferase